MMHCVACCLGKCPVCKKRYKLSSHVDACQARIAKLVAEIED